VKDNTSPPEASPESAVQRGRKPGQLGAIGGMALALALGYFALTAKTSNVLHTYLGLLILVGASLPSLLWAKRADYRFPVFEVFMLTGVNTYAIPLLTGHSQLSQYTDDTITTAGLAVLFFQVVANLVYAITTAPPKRSLAWTQEVVSRHITDYLAYGMAVTTVYTVVSEFTDLIPRELNSVLRAACFGIGIICTFIQARMWGEGTLPHHRKGVFIFQLFLQVFFSWAALFLIGGLSILVLALLGYTSGGRKIPVLAIALVLPVVGILHSGKSVMRDKYWEGGAPRPTITELPSFFQEWIGHGLEPPAEGTTLREAPKVLDRTSLFHIFCLVVSRTPDPLPYLEGETYGFVPGQFVPSVFWDAKPPAHIATNTLSVYYGLQVMEATVKTTIAFGLLTEAYANFGFIGMGLIAIFFAFCFKKFGCWAARSPILSYPGLAQIVLMAWSFQAELTFAAWSGSLYQACIVVLGIPFLVRKFLGE
jgi:hypothetical protein